MSTDAPGALRADACPDPEQLAAYIDAGLTPDERTLVERHLVTCPDCRDIIGGSVDALKEIRKVRRFPVRRMTVVAASALAAAAAVVLMVRFSGGPDPLAELRAAIGPTRAIEPRLSGDLPYRPLEPVMRSGAQPDVSPDLAAAAASLEKRVQASRSAANLQALGQAQLFTRAVDEAIRSLEDAAALDTANPRIRIDLAAAYLARGRRLNDPADFARALATLDSRGADVTSPEGLFNRALALELLGRRSDAAAAWTRYLDRDSQSEWAGEARIHLAGLSR